MKDRVVAKNVRFLEFATHRSIRGSTRPPRQNQHAALQPLSPAVTAVCLVIWACRLQLVGMID